MPVTIQTPCFDSVAWALERLAAEHPESECFSSWYVYFQVYLKREGSVDGPLTPLRIKDVVLRKYRSVR